MESQLTSGVGDNWSSALASTQSSLTPLPHDLSSSSSFGKDLDGITKLLPSCQRCKRLRRRCDTLIPSCRQCEKAKVDCMYHDNTLLQVLPRSYVHSLLNRLEQLKAAQGAAQGLVDIYESGNASRDQCNSDSSNVSNIPDESRKKSRSFDVHCYMETDKAPILRFFGSSSAIALTVELLTQVYNDGLLEPTSEQPLYMPAPNTIASAYKQANYEGLLRKEALLPLIQLYQNSLNLIYPFLDESSVEEDLEYVLLRRSPETPGSTITSGTEAYQYFRIMMICSNACATKSRHEPHFTFIGNAYYNEALRYVEQVTSEVSAESLQALLLLIVYCLFYPQKGDIWKLLDFACRLSVELGYHREEKANSNLQRDQHSQGLRRSCFWSLYTIERIVGQIFGRTSDLPEPIITTGYPMHTDDREAVMAQLVHATHHHRLVYLRSEIYRHMYLPTNPPSDGIQWYLDQFHTLYQWHQESGLESYTPGVSTVTCTVAYHATIIFLFQPLVLRALSLKSPSTSSDDEIMSIPSDNYYSACKLIETYEKILQAPESAPFGLYPMTFMSAHYIYLAGLTLMAYCVICLNNRVQVLSPWSSPEIVEGPFAIDFTSILESSASCLILLTWCSEKWRGMSGMLDTYKRLSQVLLPLKIRNSTSWG